MSPGTLKPLGSPWFERWGGVEDGPASSGVTTFLSPAAGGWACGGVASCGGVACCPCAGGCGVVGAVLVGVPWGGFWPGGAWAAAPAGRSATVIKLVATAKALTFGFMVSSGLSMASNECRVIFSILRDHCALALAVRGSPRETTGTGRTLFRCALLRLPDTTSCTSRAW